MDEGTEVPSEISDLDTDTIEKKVKLSHDGRQLMIRIPREITDFYNLKQGDSIKMIVKISAEDKRSNREIPMEIMVMECKT
jgi:hypothetical protein